MNLLIRLKLLQDGHLKVGISHIEYMMLFFSIAFKKLKEKLGKRIADTKVVNGRFLSVTPSKVREGSSVLPPNTPVWAVAEKYRVSDSSSTSSSLEIQREEEAPGDDEESPWEFEDDSELSF